MRSGDLLPDMPKPTDRAVRRRKRLKKGLIAVVAMALACEIASYLAIGVATGYLGWPIHRRPVLFASQTAAIDRVLSPTEGALVRFDPELGWVVIADNRTSLESVNAQGARGRREYRASPPEGCSRVLAFGDSFVFASEVGDEDAWPAAAERSHPDIEVMNFGVPAYGPDQAYLRFSRVRDEYEAAVAFFGITPVALDRMLTCCMRFLDPRPEAEFLVKPRVVVGPDGQLGHRPPPLADLAAVRHLRDHPAEIARLGESDFWYDAPRYEWGPYDYLASVRLMTFLFWRVDRRFLAGDRPLVGSPGAAVFNRESSAFHALLRLIDEFRDRSRDAGLIPVVGVFPDRHCLERARRGDSQVTQPLLERLAAGDVDRIDFSLAFAQHDAPLDDLFMPAGHYSAAGNRIVAESFVREIRKLLSRRDK